MSLTMSVFMTETPCFPRVSGDEPAAIDGYNPYVKFSPRERG